MAQEHPIDVLEPVKCKIAFLGDVFCQDKLDDFHFSIAGISGLYFILCDIEDGITEAQTAMKNYQEVRA